MLPLLFMRYWELLLGVSFVTTWSACTDTHARKHTHRLIIYEQGHRDARARLVWGLNPSNGGGESVRETLRLHGDEITGMMLEEGVSNAAAGKWNRDAFITSKHQGNDGPFSGCCCTLPEIWFTAKTFFTNYNNLGSGWFCSETVSKWWCCSGPHKDWSAEAWSTVTQWTNELLTSDSLSHPH